MELYYRKSGGGEPLIILHGLFGSGMNWSTLSKFFAQRYEVYLVDQRNHGKSPHDDIFNYDVMAADMAQFFVDHDIESASIIGHSMGGKTAIQLALAYPSLVNKLVAVDMGIKEQPVQDAILQEGLLSLDFDSILTRKAADKAMEAYIPDWGTRQFILQNIHWTADKKLGWRMNVKAIIENIDEIGREIVVHDPYQGEALFVKGALSDYIVSQDIPSLMKAFPKAKIEEIPNAGHWVHADNPTYFGEVVMRFLEGK